MDMTLRRRTPTKPRVRGEASGGRTRLLVVTGHMSAAVASLALTCATLAMTASLVTRLG
jgi:hypothetical protein